MWLEIIGGGEIRSDLRADARWLLKDEGLDWTSLGRCVDVRGYACRAG